jgi:hypothetical protein
MIIKSVKTFIYGIINSIDSDTIPRGAAVDSLNWITEGDKIELRRGYRILGTDNQGGGRATGILKAVDAAGVDQLFGSYQSKLVHFNRDTELFDEIGSDILGDDVIESDGYGEEISFSEYVGLAGNQVWVNSPNIAGIFKIMTANPTDAVDQYNASKNHKGHIIIDTNRMFLWGKLTDKTGLRGSYIDSQNYTEVASEVLGTGDDVEVTFTGTLAFKSGGSKRTCFGISVTDGVETFTDDFNGNLTGDQGGTGTINYATGEISVTFNTAVTNSTNVLVDYQWEDSTDNGIADFTEGVPRTAGQGFQFRQDEGGGELQTVRSYKNIYYCFHVTKTWALNLSNDDTNATNDSFRTLVGVPSLRGAVETGEGIYYLDNTTDNDPEIKVLRYGVNGLDEVVPVPKSQKLDLNDYRFNRTAGFRFGKYVLFACRTSDSDVNNRVLIHNTELNSWDILDYFTNGFAIYDGKLVAADSLSNNFSELFSGEDDDESEIPNYWISDLDDHDIDGLKKTKTFYMRGQIGPEQEIDVSFSFDGGSYVYFGTIAGSGSYVNQGQSVNVGALTLGEGEIGGGGSGRAAYQYERKFKIRTSKYERISVKFEATKIGYASISEYRYWDVRLKGQKVPLGNRG